MYSVYKNIFFVNGHEIQFPLCANSLGSSYKFSLLALEVIMRETKKTDSYSVFEKINSNEYIFLKNPYFNQRMKLPVAKRSSHALLLCKQAKQTASQKTNWIKIFWGFLKI